MWSLRWSLSLGGNFSVSRAYLFLIACHALRGGSAVDEYCRHDDVDLKTDEDYHVIKCNQCSRWWQCYGDLRVIWRNFIKFDRLNGGEPATVNIVGCLPEAWTTTENKVKDAV